MELGLGLGLGLGLELGLGLGLGLGLDHAARPGKELEQFDAVGDLVGELDACVALAEDGFTELHKSRAEQALDGHGDDHDTQSTEAGVPEELVEHERPDENLKGCAPEICRAWGVG